MPAAFSIDLQTIFTGALTLMCGGLVWFLKGIFGDIKIAVGRIQDLTIEAATTRVRIEHIEREVSSMRERQHDMGEYLQGLGFKLREDRRAVGK